jgi:hypothetical protein
MAAGASTASLPRPLYALPKPSKQPAAPGSAFPVEWDRRIYLASSATLIDLLREMDGDPESVLMVGHNPGLEDLIFDLVPDDGSSLARDRRAEIPDSYLCRPGAGHRPLGRP